MRDLATWLLSEEMPKWNRDAVDAAIATGAHQEVTLPKKVPVAGIDLTAWMTKDQTVQFRNDVYAQDGQLLELPPRKPPSSTRPPIIHSRRIYGD